MLYDQFFIDDLKSRADLVRRLLMLVTIVGLVGFNLQAQEPPKAILVDAIKKPYCEDLLLRLDLLAADATKASGYGIVVIQLGRNPFENAAYERAIAKNSAFRSFPDGLIRTVRVESKSDEPNLEFWRIVNGSEVLKQDVPLGYVVKISSRTRFVNDSLEVYRYDGKLDYFSDDCTSAFSLDVLAKVLSFNTDVSAEMIIFNKTTNGARRLSSLIRRTSRSDHKIPDNRLKIVLGGKGPAKEWAANVSAVEIWLVTAKPK